MLSVAPAQNIIWYMSLLDYRGYPALEFEHLNSKVRHGISDFRMASDIVARHSTIGDLRIRILSAASEILAR